MIILLSRNKEIIKEYIAENSKIGFIATASELEDITCPSIDYLEKLDDRTQAPLLNNCNAMNLVNFYILPHYKSKKKYTKLADEIEKDYKNYNFVKLSNEQAIIIDDSNKYKVVETK